jgi:hypothetical protein
MFSNPPTVKPGNEPIRLYEEDYTKSEASTTATEAGSSSDDVNSEEDEEEAREQPGSAADLAFRLKRSQDYIDLRTKAVEHRLEGDPALWSLDPPRDCQTIHNRQVTVTLVTKPTISKVPHLAVTPMIYRQLKNLGSLQNLAILLQTLSNWEELYMNVVKCHRSVVARVRDFQNIPDDLEEVNVQWSFSQVVIAIADSLGIHLKTLFER